MKFWDRTVLDSYKLPHDDPVTLPWAWRDHRYLAHRFGGARVRLAVLMRMIEQLKPASVLEVGCGNGINLLYLAGRFPETRFTGVELTEAGVRTAQACQQQWEEFPEDLLAFSPEPQKDRTAFRRVDFHQGSAASIPFANGSFDLVITVLALEQMERIRKKALTEIARTTARHVLMIEPFRDVNERGLRRRYVVAQNYFAESKTCRNMGWSRSGPRLISPRRRRCSSAVSSHARRNRPGDPAGLLLGRGLGNTRKINGLDAAPADVTVCVQTVTSA